MKTRISEETLQLINEALRKQLLDAGIDLMDLVPDKAKLLAAIEKVKEKEDV